MNNIGNLSLNNPSINYINNSYINNGLYNYNINNSMPNLQNVNNNNFFGHFPNNNSKSFVKDSEFKFKQVFGSKLKQSKYLLNFNEKKLHLNIIYYDESLKSSKENSLYCSSLKMQTLGTFYGIHHYNLFIYICKRIINDNKRFILISSGSSAVKIFNLCCKYNQFTNFYIFCFDKSKYINLLGYYPKLKGVFTDFDSLFSALSSNHEEINYEIKSSNLFYLNDYNRIYIKLHFEIIRKYSLYKIFKSQNENQNKFFELIEKKKPYYREIARQLLYHDENEMINYFKQNTGETEETLKNLFKKEHNANIYIWKYTSEFFYYKYINKFLREGNFDLFRKLSNHISKFIYYLYEYKKTQIQNNEGFVYRNMNITQGEFNNYLSSIGQVICYPAFTSTSLEQNCNCGNFEIQNQNVMIKLIIKLNGSKSVVCISKNSAFPNEKEYLFMPFSFFKITNIKKGFGSLNNPHLIYLTALKSTQPIEDLFLDFMQNETDNLDPEGLKMIKLSDLDDTFMDLNPNLFYKNYSKL